MEKPEVKKLPIGLIPRFIHDTTRLHKVRLAISRYYTAGVKIPIEWIEEYNDLVEKYENKQENS